jgi:hypothetical protein
MRMFYSSRGLTRAKWLILLVMGDVLANVWCHVVGILIDCLGRIADPCAHQYAGPWPMYFRRKTSAGRGYLQIVESRRDGHQVRQQVIATLGRFEELKASGGIGRSLAA